MFSFTIYIIIAAVGFMMTYLYKSSNTYTQFFSPNPQKGRRLFTVVFTAALLIAFGLSFYALYVLRNTPVSDDKSIAFSHSTTYNNAMSVLVFIINLSFLSLILLCNVISLSAKKIAWLAYVLAFLFYALFVIKNAYLIMPYFIRWQQAFKLHEIISPEIIPAWLKITLGFAVTAANAFMAWWALKNKKFNSGGTAQ